MIMYMTLLVWVSIYLYNHYYHTQTDKYIYIYITEGSDFALLNNFETYKIMFNINWAQNRNSTASPRTKNKQQKSWDQTIPPVYQPVLHLWCPIHMISTVPLAQMAAGFEKHRTGKVRRAVSVQTSRLRQPQRQTSGRWETSPYSALLGLGCCMRRRGALSTTMTIHINIYFKPVETAVQMKGLLISTWQLQTHEEKVHSHR